jgi:hypothetical protein
MHRTITHPGFIRQVQGKNILFTFEAPMDSFRRILYIIVLGGKILWSAIYGASFAASL